MIQGQSHLLGVELRKFERNGESHPYARVRLADDGNLIEATCDVEVLESLNGAREAIAEGIPTLVEWTGELRRGRGYDYKLRLNTLTEV